VEDRGPDRWPQLWLLRRRREEYECSGMETRSCDLWMDIKPCLHQAIDLMEVLYGAAHGSAGGKVAGCGLKDGVERLEEDLWDLEYSPQKAVVIAQTQLVWDLAVRRKVPTRWFLRTHRPVTVLLSAIYERAEVPIERNANAELTEEDFSRLTCTVGRLAGAPLRMSDAREAGALLESLPEFFSEVEPCCVVCDWPLDGEELAAALQLKDESEISFLCPRA
jgi:hypothetical protein